MPVITDEAMNAVVLEPPWKMGDDDMLGKMISEWEYKNKNMGCLSVVRCWRNVGCVFISDEELVEVMVEALRARSYPRWRPLVVWVKFWKLEVISFIRNPSDWSVVCNNLTQFFVADSASVWGPQDG